MKQIQVNYNIVNQCIALLINKGKPEQKIKENKMQSESKNQLNNPNTEIEQQIVLFKFKRAFREESFDEIKIHSKKIKANPELNQKATQQYKKRHFLDREAMLTEMFQKLELKNNQSESKKALNDKNTEQSSQKKSSYFLKRVELQELLSTQQQKPLANEQIKIEANRIRGQIRRQGLQQRLNRNRGIFPTTNQGQKKRIKYKIIDIRQENLVQLNGQKIEYEDLSKEYSEEEKLRMGTVYDYYVLRKGQITGNNGYQPEIILPQQAQYLLEEEQGQRMNEQSPQQSEDDSNREDRSDYDYPQQDYREGDSDNESEDIISGDKNMDSDYDGSNQDYNLKNDYRDVEDQEEYYRQYLKRCRRKEKGDDQITYLYNMKPAKYEDDSDQY